MKKKPLRHPDSQSFIASLTKAKDPRVFSSQELAVEKERSLLLGLYERIDYYLEIFEKAQKVLKILQFYDFHGQYTGPNMLNVDLTNTFLGDVLCLNEDEFEEIRVGWTPGQPTPVLTAGVLNRHGMIQALLRFESNIDEFHDFFSGVSGNRIDRNYVDRHLANYHDIVQAFLKQYVTTLRIIYTRAKIGYGSFGSVKNFNALQSIVTDPKTDGKLQDLPQISFVMDICEFLATTLALREDYPETNQIVLGRLTQHCVRLSCSIIGFPQIILAVIQQTTLVETYLRDLKEFLSIALLTYDELNTTIFSKKAKK